MIRYSCRILFDCLIVSESKWPRVQWFYLLSSSFNSFQLKTSRCWSPLILKITFYLFSLGSVTFIFPISFTKSSKIELFLELIIWTCHFSSEAIGIFRDLTSGYDSDVTELMESNKREWSCNGENRLSFFTFWELMEFLRRRFAHGGARRFVQLLCFLSVAAIAWKNAKKTFFRGFTVCYSFHYSNGSGRKQWFGFRRSHPIAPRR